MILDLYIINPNQNISEESFMSQLFALPLHPLIVHIIILLVRLRLPRGHCDLTYVELVDLNGIF